MTAAKPAPTVARRHVSDEVRQAAFQLCAAARRLENATRDPLYKPKMLIGPTLDDLVDARTRLDAVLPARQDPTP